MQVGVDIRQGDQVGQLACQGSLNFAAVFAQFGRHPGQAEGLVDLFFGGEHAGVAVGIGERLFGKGQPLFLGHLAQANAVIL